MSTVEQMFADLTALTAGPFEQIRWAEDEITAAQARHPECADLLYHGFALLCATQELMGTEFVYRSHARELLERVAAGADTRDATGAEVAIACSEASLVAPMGSAAMTLYMRTWATAFPDVEAFTHLDLQAYEHVAGERVDELERVVRHRLHDSDRTLTTESCTGRHHGEPAPTCPLHPTTKEPTVQIFTACVSPLDTPRSELDERSYRFFWPLRQVVEDHRQDPGWAGVELRIYHSTNRKEFFTSLNRVTVYDQGWAEATAHSDSLLATPVWRKSAPVARYSAKALREFTEAALAEFQALFVEGHEGIRGLFAAVA